MNTAAFPTSISLGGSADALSRLKQRFGPMAAVAGFHLVLGYAFYSGLMTRVVDVVMPKEVEIAIITPSEPVSEPAPVLPKTVPLAPPPLMVPPVAAIIVETPPPTAITLPPPQPAPIEKVSAPVIMSSPAVAAAPAPAAGPRTITSGVEYVQPPRPEYPSMSKRLGEQGKVMLRVLIDERGQPNQVTVHASSGFSRLDEAGRKAALRAMFKPHLEDGRAVPVYVIVPLNFSLAT